MSLNSDLAQADQYFTDKKYTEAGQAYARLASQNQLPVERQQVWAYCRWVAVVALINAQPHSDREWDEIEQEIRNIQKLTPGNWYGKYLLNRVAEARRGGRGSARAGKVVVRGSAPDENPIPRFPRLLARARPTGDSPRGPASGGGAEQPLGLPLAAGSQDPRTAPETAARSGAAQNQRATKKSSSAAPLARWRCNSLGQEVTPMRQRLPELQRPFRGTFARPPTFEFTIQTRRWPRRRPRPPRQFAISKPGAGEARPHARSGLPRAIFTSIPLLKTSPT